MYVATKVTLQEGGTGKERLKIVTSNSKIGWLIDLKVLAVLSSPSDAIIKLPENSPVNLGDSSITFFDINPKGVKNEEE